MERSVGMTLAVQSGCFVTSSPNMSAYLRELASDVGTLQQRLLLAGSVPTVTLVLAKISHAERFIPIEEWLSGSGDEVASERIVNEKDTHSL